MNQAICSGTITPVSPARWRIRAALFSAIPMTFAVDGFAPASMWFWRGHPLHKAADGYVIHEAGKPPGFALEAASHTTRRRGDTGPKQTLYAQIGIGEYWRSDPTGGARYGSSLAGDILTGGEYQPVELTTEKDGMV